MGLIDPAAVGSAQVIMLRLRANRTAAFVRRLRLVACSGKSLPAGSVGLPHRSDFWVSPVALAFFTLLYFASSPRH
jgi:hypothetical protein